MTTSLQALAAEALKTGRIKNLPTRHFIDGKWVESQSGEMLETLDPGTGEVITAVSAGNEVEIEAAVDAADRAQRGSWRRTSPAERAEILLRAARIMRQRAEPLAVVESLDSGKTLAEAQGDVAGSARCFEYYAGMADKLHGETIPRGSDLHSYTLVEPAGVTAHVIPWNYPTSTTVRGIAPALAAGCTAVVKPAETTPLTALMIADILNEAGLPAGVLNVVNGTGPAAGAPLVAHKKVAHVTFTGSVNTGSMVMQAAARNITSVTLELGGKSPAVVLADADLDRAVEEVVWAINSNSGQICSAGSRLVIEKEIHGAFMARLVDRTGRLTLGHGLKNRDMGAINSQMQLDRIDAHVDAARARGLEIATGGYVASDPDNDKGYFYAPTIVDNCPANDAIVQEEVFGPVLAVQVADDFDHAVDLANGTDFGLMSAVFTRDLSKAHRFIRDVDAGQVAVNDYWANGLEVPFGGNKLSGIGREKGVLGLEAYTRTKGVSIRL